MKGSACCLTGCFKVLRTHSDNLVQAWYDDYTTELCILILLLLVRPQSIPCISLSPAIPVIHRCWQAVPGDPGVRLQQIKKCASLSSEAPFAMLRFPQNQILVKWTLTLNQGHRGARKQTLLRQIPQSSQSIWVQFGVLLGLGLISQRNRLI